MGNKNKNGEIEDKLIEELDEDYESGGNRKLMIIGGGVAAVLIIVAFVLSFVGGDKEEDKKQAAEAPVGDKKVVAHEDDYSRNADAELAEKASEPEQSYPARTSGSRVAIDKEGKSIEGVPIQKSLMIDDAENPFHALHTIAPEIYELMEVNFYDVRNEALPVSEFIDKTRVGMPNGLFNRLDNFYRIFMYRAVSEKGPGTAMVFSTSIGKNEVEGLMKEWEGTMVNNLKPFVMIGLERDLVAASGKKTFSDSSIYQGGRYVDFSKDGIVGLNYYVSGKYIILANSRSTFEKVIEVINK